MAAMKSVFISYRQIDDAQRVRVRSFAERLRGCGLNVILDQFYLDEHPGGPSEKWPKWSSDCATKTEHVIIIGSEAWFRCFDGTEKPGTGLGAACEADDLRQRIYDAANINDDIRVVLFDNADAKFISSKLKGYHRFHAEHDFASIVKWLGGSLPADLPHLKTSIPNNLPRLQPFFGRTEELKQIREALDPENRTWGALIDGAGGIGKTSLAVRAAYDCTPDQFERIIFLSVKDRELDDDGVRELGIFILPGFLEMLNELARQLGQSEITKAPEDQRTRLLLEALSAVQALLIFDNLESLPKSDRDQLFTFVKRLPQGCKAILTSRRRIGSGSEELILEKLDEAAALATLADLARHNPLLAKTNEAERVTLYRQTGGKPLLLRWVAGQLGRGNCRTFTDALNFLGSCPPENDPLEFIFGDLVGEFTAEETGVLCALTYFTLPAKVEHIAEVASLKKELVESALNSLANRSLVVPDQEEEYFALVPMVAEFLRRKRPKVIGETGDRLEKRAYALIIENGHNNHDRFPILEFAWPMVAPALPLFLAGSAVRLQGVCDALSRFLDYSGRWDERLLLNQRAEKSALEANDLLNAGWCAYRAGYIYFLQGQADELLACAERVEAHWRGSDAGPRERAIALGMRGNGHELNEDYKSAVFAYREAYEQLLTLDKENSDVSIALDDLATAEQLCGDYEGAERDYLEALRVATTVGYMHGVANSKGNLATLALVREDWAKAEILAREALSISEKIGRLELIAANCDRLAGALASQGKKEEALPYARRAIEIFKNLGSPDFEKVQERIREYEE